MLISIVRIYTEQPGDQSGTELVKATGNIITKENDGAMIEKIIDLKRTQ